VVGGLLLFWALECAGFGSCSTWAQAWLFSGSGAQAQQLWGTPREACSRELTALSAYVRKEA